jgi:hypothetical protein
LRGRDDLIGQGEQLLGLRDNLLADRGYPHRAVGALEQRDTEVVLEFTNLAAQCRLTYVASAGRPAEVFFVSNGDDISQISDIHDPQYLSK